MIWLQLFLGAFFFVLVPILLIKKACQVSDGLDCWVHHWSHSHYKHHMYVKKGEFVPYKREYLKCNRCGLTIKGKKVYNKHESHFRL